MTTDRKIIKIKKPKTVMPCEIISRPTGDNPYYLVAITPKQIKDHDLSADVVEDTAAFYSQFNMVVEEEGPTP